MLLPQAVGLRMAREMSFTGNFIDSAEALRVGLVNRVVPHEQLLDIAIAIGNNIATADQEAVRALKDLYDRGPKLAPGAALELELEVFRNRRLPAETIEARRAGLLDRNRERT